jgi:hypothetical protein
MRNECYGDQQINGDLLKKIKSGQLIKGYHGTSSGNAKKIEDGGFENHTCIEGQTGVWFWDSDVQQNASYNGTQKARKTGDKGYAIIEAELTKPQPDIKGRKQWLSSASCATVTKVSYFNLEDN